MSVEQRPFCPWDTLPALKRYRLTALARIIWDTRVSAAKEARWEIGDGRWDIGAKAFSRARYAISKASAGVHSGWLSIQDKGTHFVYGIGGVPVRHYRGARDEGAPERFAKPDQAEAEMLQLVFDLPETTAPPVVLRFIVDTDSMGFPTSIDFAQVDPSGIVVNSWRIPVHESETVIPLEVAREAPITPPGPQVLDEEAERAREAKADDIEKQRGA